MEYDLVGFVMDALDDDEYAQVIEALENSAELQEQVALIQSALGPLESYRYCEPPAGLYEFDIGLCIRTGGRTQSAARQPAASV